MTARSRTCCCSSGAAATLVFQWIRCVSLSPCHRLNKEIASKRLRSHKRTCAPSEPSWRSCERWSAAWQVLPRPVRRLALAGPPRDARFSNNRSLRAGLQRAAADARGEARGPRPRLRTQAAPRPRPPTGPAPCSHRRHGPHRNGWPQKPRVCHRLSTGLSPAAVDNFSGGRSLSRPAVKPVLPQSVSLRPARPRVDADRKLTHLKR